MVEVMDFREMGEALGDALDRICQEASAAIEAGATFLVLSDRVGGDAARHRPAGLL